MPSGPAGEVCSNRARDRGAVSWGWGPQKEGLRPWWGRIFHPLFPRAIAVMLARKGLRSRGFFLCPAPRPWAS